MQPASTKAALDDVGDLLRPGEAAKLLCMSLRGLSDLSDAGYLRAVRFRPNGERRYVARDVARLRSSFVNGNTEGA